MTAGRGCRSGAASSARPRTSARASRALFAPPRNQRNRHVRSFVCACVRAFPLRWAGVGHGERMLSHLFFFYVWFICTWMHACVCTHARAYACPSACLAGAASGPAPVGVPDLPPTRRRGLARVRHLPHQQAGFLGILLLGSISLGIRHIHIRVCRHVCIRVPWLKTQSSSRVCARDVCVCFVFVVVVRKSRPVSFFLKKKKYIHNQKNYSG